MDGAPHKASPLDIALELADTYGWFVHPVIVKPKPDGKSEKIYLTNWGAEASSDPDEIVAMLTSRARKPAWDHATHVAVSCEPSGIWVIDEDAPGAVDGLGLPETLIMSTRRGRHYVFRSGPFDQRNTESEPAKHVDIRANGGNFVVYGHVIHDADIAPWPFSAPIGGTKGQESPAAPTAQSGGFKEVDDYRRLFQGASTDGEKHKATRDIAASLAAQGVKKDFTIGLIQAVCPVWDGNLIKSIDSGYAKFAPEGPPVRASRFYSAASLKGKPVKQREWLVHGDVPKKTVTLFGGDGGTGKSLLALQLTTAVVSGTVWLGKQVAHGRAIFLSAEDDDDELHRRLDDILRAEGLDYDDVSGLTMRSLAGEDALLAVETQIALMQSALFEELDARAAEESPALIVIDTLADVYPANENDRAKVRQFIGILRSLALKRDCAVMLLGHPSLTGLNSGSGTSGSTAWNNSVRSRLYLSRITDGGFEADPDRRVMTTMKANYGRVGGEIHMKWKNGVFVAEAQPTGLDALAAGAKAQRVFMKLLATLTAQGRRVNHAGGSSYAPKLFAEHPDNEGMTKRAFKAAMEGLLAAGRIKIESEGPPSRRSTFIVEAGQ